MSSDAGATVGLNGVAIARHSDAAKRYRTYEIHQRRRVGESTQMIRPRALISREFLLDPYPTLATLREHYPCYLDWLGNAYWITRYDDVTSVFVDEANFVSRSKRFFYGLEPVGRDLRRELPVERHHERTFDDHAGPLAAELVAEMKCSGSADLAKQFAARLPLELLAREWGIEPGDRGAFVERYWRMQRGVHAHTAAEAIGRAAFFELIDYFRPLLEARRAHPHDDLVSVIAGLDLADGPATAADLVATLLESDHETLHGALSNLWLALLTHPEQLERIRAAPPEERMMKLAYLEALRHSPDRKSVV
jgi:cytochrome P450